MPLLLKPPGESLEGESVDPPLYRVDRPLGIPGGGGLHGRTRLVASRARFGRTAEIVHSEIVRYLIGDPCSSLAAIWRTSR